MHPGRDADTWISVDAFCIALGYGEAEPNTSSPPQSELRAYVRAYVESSQSGSGTGQQRLEISVPAVGIEVHTMVVIPVP